MIKYMYTIYKANLSKVFIGERSEEMKLSEIRATLNCEKLLLIHEDHFPEEIKVLVGKINAYNGLSPKVKNQFFKVLNDKNGRDQVVVGDVLIEEIIDDEPSNLKKARRK